MSVRPTMKFARVGWWRTGYNPAQVDDFFSSMSGVLNGQMGHDNLSPEDVRRASFAKSRNGYNPKQVDSALDRIELDALDRQRAVALSQGHTQEDQQYEQQQQVQQALAVVRRRRGERFARSQWWARYPGYAMAEVDAFCERVAAVLQGGRGPGLRAVRQVDFRSQRGGYREDEVDAFLDQVVGILLRRRY